MCRGMMREQYIEYIRQQLITALSDFSGATKGQLQAWLENAQFVTGRFRRKKIKVRDDITGKWYTLDNPPVPGKQSLAKGSAIELILPVEYRTASWRRAVLSLEEHQKAWLLWTYGGSMCWEHQVTLVRWAWTQFRGQLGTRKIAGKTRERLKNLIWLAAQDVSMEIKSGVRRYEYQFLAVLSGVSKSTWTRIFAHDWLSMRSIFKSLDYEALRQASVRCSQQKDTNRQTGIAKCN